MKGIVYDTNEMLVFGIEVDDNGRVKQFKRIGELKDGHS